MTLILAVAATHAHATDPRAAYLAFVKSNPAFQVHISAVYNGKTASDGTLVIQRPQRLLYKAHGSGFAYSISVTEAGYTEIENSRKVYDEIETPGRLAIAGSDISPLANTLFPRIILAGDLNNVFRKDATLTTSGSEATLYQKERTMSGIIEVWATVDAQGHIVSARRKATNPGGPLGTETKSRDLVWRFTDYTTPKNLTLSAFLTPVPPGYVPNSVPRLATPLQVGQPAPVSGWVDARTGTKENLAEVAGHKPFLLAYIGPDSDPGEASKASLARLKSKLPVFIVGLEGLKDPDGTRLKALKPPGSPMFYLIDGKGKVVKLWFGYDRDHSSDFEADVTTAVQAAGATK